MPPKKSRSPKKQKPRAKKSRGVPPGATEAFANLVAVMHRLRAPGGCPWDREQTHATLRTYLVEEAYEVLDALDSANDAKFADELGDLLLQVLFHSEIAGETNRFNITTVLRNIHDKMIRRHPHVFGSTSARNSAEVLRNWEKIKQAERASDKSAHAAKHESALDGVPKALPSLLEAYQLTKKAARTGFDWHNIDGIFDKLDEEARELREAIPSKNHARIESELGDILFVAVNLARFLKIDPEIALKNANKKFTRRFHQMEHLARQKGTTFPEIPRPEMESLWDQSKSTDKSHQP